MSQPEFDNRIKYPPTEIDFDNTVGVTGQDHDVYPSSGTQLRYDWMRMAIIGLLANQSSNDPPTEYRTGTVWYKRDEAKFLFWDGYDWRDLANGIILGATGTTDLSQWFTESQSKLERIQPRFTYSGSVSNPLGVVLIPVPISIQTALTGIELLVRPLVYRSGLLLDPRNTRFVTGCPCNIELLNGDSLAFADKYTVVIERFDMFLTDDVIAS